MSYQSLFKTVVKTSNEVELLFGFLESLPHEDGIKVVYLLEKRTLIPEQYSQDNDADHSHSTFHGASTQLNSSDDLSTIYQLLCTTFKDMCLNGTMISLTIEALKLIYHVNGCLPEE